MLQLRQSLRDMGEFRAIQVANDSLALAFWSCAARREDRSWQMQSGLRP